MNQETNNKKSKIINCLYEHFKNTPKKLKIVCDWDEVIQPLEPYTSFKTIEDKKEIEWGFDFYFEYFWETKDIINYSPYGSVLNPIMFLNYPLEKQIEIKNSPNFYQEAPFLSIVKELLKLIKADKVAEIIFLSAYDKRVFPYGDERKQDIFSWTFGQVPRIKAKLGLNLIPFDNEKQGVSKIDWIKKHAADFAVVIDDNPIICGNITCAGELWKKQLTVIAPYYPAIEKQHHQEVLLLKTSVSDLKKEDFIKND